MRNDQGRLIQRLDHIGHGKGLAGSRNAKKRLELVSFAESLHKILNRLRLISHRLKF